jgi:hypothetical protein
MSTRRAIRTTNLLERLFGEERRRTKVIPHAFGERAVLKLMYAALIRAAERWRSLRMTYARRYALFTLVGIAGEDDLDAPDLCDGPPSPSVVDRSFKPKDDQSPIPTRMPGNGHGRGRKGEIPVILDPEQSAALREKLLSELGSITSADLAAAWAREALSAKNSLIAADAKLVEDAFERKLSELPSAETAAPPDDVTLPGKSQEIVSAKAAAPDQARGIDKSVLTVSAPRRYRNREHLRYVAHQACLVCGRKPSDPHHLGFTQPRALGRKVSDEFAVPLCRGHHRAVHRSRDERAWWRQAGIDPIKVARRLWKATHGMGQRRSERPVLARPYDANAFSDPKYKEISTTATSEEGACLPDLPLRP